MVNQANWDIAPKDATHNGFINNPDIITWYKYENINEVPTWSFWYSENGILDICGWTELDKGNVPLAIPLTPRPEYVAPPIIKEKWTPGVTLPPIGETVAIAADVLAENSSLYKIDSLEGDEVEIIAHFQSDKGVDVAVYIQKAGGGKFVKQGIAKMFKALETIEEKTVRLHKSNIRKICEEIGVDDNSDEGRVISEMYHAGRITL